MPYASEFKKTEKKSKESENYLTNTENETELPVEIPSTSFTERLDEEIEVDLAELRAHLQAIISGALPGFYEFRQAGYNLLYPKKVDIDALRARVNTMQIPALIQPQQKQLKQAANAFLDQFRKESDLHNNALEFIKFRLEVNKAGWDDPQNRDYHQALKHGNRLSGYLSGTLDLMSLINEKVEWQTPWETTRQTNYDVLLNELLPVNADAHNNQYAAQTRGNLTGAQPDNIKFNAIVDSVTLDERIAREALSAEIERLSARLLSGITLTRNYAEKPDETGETSGIKRDIDFLCQVLQSVIPVVQYAGQQIQPATYQPHRQKEARTKIETVKHELETVKPGLKKAWNTAWQKVQGVEASGRALSDKFNKNKHRIVHALPGSTASDKNGDSHNINKAVFQVGIRLLDKIQQTTSDMHKAIQTSSPLQQTVSHYSELDEMLSGKPHNSILDAKLRAESGRWRQKAEESKKQLQQALGTITTLSDESMKQRYLSALREELNAFNPLAFNNIIRDFDTQVKATVEGLSDVQKALGQALLRLSEHGQAGGKELDKHTVSWLQQLKGIKDNLKTGITQATGQSINNFSRQGMLARWMAEWREAEKQRYLGTLSAEERAATEKHYDAVFFEVIQHYLPQLSKESDPQGERLLQRLRLEVGNAAKGNTLYPATMADILAGMKSREQAIRDWAERKLIRGAFLAVCLGGFKLLPNLAALPLKFAITGAKVAWGAHKGRQGIRGGEGDISDEIAEYAKQSYKTAAIKIVLSLPPGLATTLGVASIAWRVYEGGLKGAGEKIAEHIIGEAPWHALDTGSKAAAEAYVATLIEAAITEEEITSATHSSSLQPQTAVMPFSDKRDPGADQHHVRRKRAVADSRHDIIVPSDPTRLDENDYRKEFYKSRNLSVVERHLSENESVDNQYASVSTKKNITPSSERVSVLKEIADALVGFENEDESQPISDIKRIIFVDQYLYDKMQYEDANKKEFKKEWLRVRSEINIIDNEAVKRYLDFRLVIESHDVYRGRLLKSDISDSRNELVDKMLDLFGRLAWDNDPYVIDKSIDRFESYYADYLGFEDEDRDEHRDERILKIAPIYYYLSKEIGDDRIEERYLQIINSFLPGDNKINSDTEWSQVKIINTIAILEGLQKNHREAYALIRRIDNVRGILSVNGKVGEEQFLDARIVAAQIYDGVGNISLINDRARWLKRYDDIKNEPGNYPWKLLHIESIIHYLQVHDSEASLDAAEWGNAILFISLLQANSNREIKKILHINDDKIISHSEFKTRTALDNDDGKYYSQFDNYIDDKGAEKEAGKQLAGIFSNLRLSIGDLFDEVEDAKVWSYIYKSSRGGVATPAPGRVIVIKLKGSDSGAIVISNLFLNEHVARITEDEYTRLSSIFNAQEHGELVHRSLKGPYYYRGSQAEHTKLSKILTGLDEVQIREHLNKNNFGFGYPARFSNEYPGQENVQHLKSKTLRDAIVGTKVIENKAAVSYLRSTMYSLTGWEQVAYRFVPFYEIGHRNETDREYEIDVDAFTLELISTIATVYPAAKGIAAAIKDSGVSAILKSGLKGGQLLKPLSKELARLGFNASKIFGTAVYELTDPFPINSHLSKTTVLKDAGSITKATRFPVDWMVEAPVIGNVKPDDGVYKVKKTEPETMQDFNFYIKKDDKFYPVKYDFDNNTWRLIPPENSGKSGYQAPVRRNENGEWELHTDVGLKGGGLKDFLDEIRLPGLRDVFGREIVIGEHAFKRVKYNQNKLNEMMRLAKTYAPTSNSTERIAKIQQDYKTGKEMSHAPQHDHYNSLSLDEKLDLFNKLDTDALTRGVLAGKINEYIVNINLYEAAKAADDWRKSANKATKVVLVPQSIFLKGGLGECLPASVLMGWALQSGQDAKLAKKMMGIYSAPNMAENPLYKSLFELHVDGKASEFRLAVIPDVKVSALGDAEARLFLTENASVRVGIPGHTMLLSKVNQEGKVKYVFYDPNYGLAYFDKYKDMSAFFKKELEAYNVPENSINFYLLEYSILPGVKIKGRNLDEIINGEIPQLYKQEHVNLDGISPHEGVYSMPGDKNYIKVNDDVYQVEWDQTVNTWRVFDPANTNRSRVTVAVRRDDNGEWFRHSDTGLQGGGLFDEIKRKWFSGKNSDDFGKNMSPSELDRRINKASKKDKQGYSLACYRAAFNDARQAKVIDSEQFTWLTDEVAKRDSRGEIMDSQAYRQAFSLQNKKPMTTFASANITESGFMHVGERRTDVSVHYDHIVYVHVADNEIHLYQANGADFLLKLNGTNPREKHNNIGKHVSESHYKHHMDKERIALFDGYFSDPGVDGGPQAVFAFTPASEVRDNYRIEKNRREKGTPDEAIAGPSGITKAIEPVSPKPSIEPMLETRAYRNLSAEESGLISETSAHLKTNLGQQYNTYLTLPRENCANAATAVAKELRQAGYTDVRIMELGIWPNGGVDTMPANHYVVTAKKSGIEIVIDLTAGQFERYGFSGPIISTKDNWIYQWQQNMKDKPRILVKMAPLSGGIGTSPFSMDYVNPQLTVPDGTLLQRPGWYKPGINPEQSIQRAVSKQVNEKNEEMYLQQTDAKPFSDKRDPGVEEPLVRRKRAVADTAPSPSPQWHHNIPAVATLQSEHFERFIRYQEFSVEQKKQTYLRGIQFVLFQIENDDKFSAEIRENAYLARIGARNGDEKGVQKLVPVDIRGYKLNNTIFLPDSPGSKSGVLIRLDSEIPYYYVRKGDDLLENIRWAMPYNADKQESRPVRLNNGLPGVIVFPSGVDILNDIRSRSASFEENFNYNNPNPMDIASLSATLADTMEADYKLKRETISNNLLISRAIAGAHIPDPGVSATEKGYHLEVTWANLTPAEYLRSFSRPFSILSGEMQLVGSSINGKTIQETELQVHQAEYIGSWVDATVGAITSFTPAGWVLNTAQSAADIAADLTEGKDPDPLAVAGLIVGCIPGGRIAAKVGKITHIGGKAAKYGVMLGNKAIDLAIVGKSIETAVDTGEPLAIYQALLASGMSVKNSYDMAKNMSSQLEINRKMEDSASLKELEVIHNNTPESSLGSTMSERTFRVGSTVMLGRINNGEIEISRNNGVAWERGGKLHLLTYRLQNAGGGSKSIRLNGRIYRNHNAISSQAQKLSLIKTNYEIYSMEPDSAATAAQQRARRDFEAGERECKYDEFSRFDSLNLSKKIESLKLDTSGGQTLTHRQKGALWKKAHDQFWEDLARKQIMRGQEWFNSAKKNYNATGGEVSPQGAYLRGKNQGECEPVTILMARAQREGKGNELARSLMGLFDDPDNALGTSLGRLRSQSGIKGEALAGVRLSALETSERTLFPGSTDEATSVRLELKEGDSSIRNHVVLLSRSKGDSGNYIYSFFDPNYGYVEFSKYNDMAVFVKKRVQIKSKAKGGYENRDADVDFSMVSNHKLDEVTRNVGYFDNGIDHFRATDMPGSSTHGSSLSETSITFEPTIFKQALTEFLNQQTAQGPGDPAYVPYQSAFNSLPENQEITLQQVNDLKYALSASGNSLIAQAKYHYALLAYLSGPKGIQLPIDTNEIRKRIEKEIEHADYVYGCKVKERDKYLAQLNKAIGRRNEIRERYSDTIRTALHANADRRVVKLRNEVDERNRLMNEWASKKNQASLRLEIWNDSCNWAFFD